MNKKLFLWIILDLIFLVIFNALFFVIGGIVHNITEWISYGFIHFAYFMLLLTPKLIRHGKSSAVFGFSIYSISAVYFFLEFIAGVVFILIFFIYFKYALLVQLILAGLYGILLVANMLANEYTAEAEEKRQNEIAYVKDATLKLKLMLAKISDKDIKKKVERVYDVVNSSPVKSHPDMEQIETGILQSINELDAAVSAANNESIISIADSLFSAVNERNARLQRYN